MIDRFLKQKNDILSKQDKSSKGFWDKRIKGLCDKINLFENYYTTSSCSGRIVLMLDKNKKTWGLFRKVYHDLICFEKLKKDLRDILDSLFYSSPPNSRPRSANSKENLLPTTKSLAQPFKGKGEIKGKKLVENENIKFKLESCALHVACRSLKDAQRIYDKAKLAGWKHSGIIASGNRFMAELTSTEKLEFPIIQNGKLLVDDEFLKVIVEEANKKLKRGWERIEKFEEIV